jgi:hypothetical protein
VRICRADRRQDVTGLTVNESPNVRRDFVRELDSTIHCWRKHGAAAVEIEYLRKRRLPDAGIRARPNWLMQILLGKVAFLRMVKHRHDPVLRRLQWALHDLNPKVARAPVDLCDASPAPLRGHVGRFRGWQWISRAYESSVKYVQLVRDGCAESYSRLASSFLFVMAGAP